MSLAASLRTMAVRGLVTAAQIGARTVLSVRGLGGRPMDRVELLLPPGYVANPAAGATVILIPMLGAQDGVVALGGDTEGGAVANLAAGEVGISGIGGQVIIRTTGVQILMPGETLRKLMTETAMAVYNSHTHPSHGAPPTQQMNAADLTTTFQAGGS
jgi:phage gp45-like